MVDPTKVNPRRFKSLATRSDSSVRAGRSDIFRGRLTTRHAVDPVPTGKRRTIPARRRWPERPGRSVTVAPHLEPVAHDARVLQQLGDLLFAVAGDPSRVEAVERPSVVLPLVEDGRPGQAGLGPLEDEHLEEVGVVVGGNAPLLVVVPAHGLRALGPVATPTGAGTRSAHVLRPAASERAWPRATSNVSRRDGAGDTVDEVGPGGVHHGRHRPAAQAGHHRRDHRCRGRGSGQVTQRWRPGRPRSGQGVGGEPVEERLQGTVEGGPVDRGGQDQDPSADDAAATASSTASSCRRPRSASAGRSTRSTSRPPPPISMAALARARVFDVGESPLLTTTRSMLTSGAGAGGHSRCLLSVGPDHRLSLRFDRSDDSVRSGGSHGSHGSHGPRVAEAAECPPGDRRL